MFEETPNLLQRIQDEGLCCAFATLVGPQEQCSLPSNGGSWSSVMVLDATHCRRRYLPRQAGEERMAKVKKSTDCPLVALLAAAQDRSCSLAFAAHTSRRVPTIYSPTTPRQVALAGTGLLRVLPVKGKRIMMNWCKQLISSHKLNWVV